MASDALKLLYIIIKSANSLHEAHKEQIISILRDKDGIIID